MNGSVSIELVHSLCFLVVHGSLEGTVKLGDNPLRLAVKDIVKKKHSVQPAFPRFPKESL